MIKATFATIISFQSDLDGLISRMAVTMWMQRSCTQVALLYMRYNNWSFDDDAIRFPIVFPVTFLALCLALIIFPISEVEFVGNGTCLTQKSTFRILLLEYMDLSLC